MKNKSLAIVFLIILFFVAAINIPNAMKSLEPAIDKYLMHEDVIEIDSVNTAIDQIESSYNEDFVSKYAFVNLHGLTRNVMGSHKVNETIKLKNGYLSYTYDKLNMREFSEPVIALNKYLDDNDTEFLYVSAPFKTDPTGDQIPTGIKDYSNLNQDNMLEQLNGENVRTYDLRVKLMEKDEDWYEFFFTTDHHWKPEAGFWAYTEIARQLNLQFGYEMDSDSMDISNYKVEVLEDWFLGSQGRKTGKYYAGVDDISIITPDFDTNMRVEIPKYNLIREGSYEEVMFNSEKLQKDYYSINSYAAYIGGDYPLCIQKNKDAENSEKLLILKDSFSLVTQPYFSFMFEQVDVIDLRYFTETSLKQYIDETNPDIVIALYTSSLFDFPEAFVFGL